MIVRQSGPAFSQLTTVSSNCLQLGD